MHVLIEIKVKALVTLEPKLLKLKTKKSLILTCMSFAIFAMFSCKLVFYMCSIACLTLKIIEAHYILWVLFSVSCTFEDVLIKRFIVK